MLTVEHFKNKYVASNQEKKTPKITR